MDAATRSLLISVQVCFGVFPLLGKVAMESFSPRAVLVWRLLVGAAVLMAFAIWRHGRGALPAPRDLAMLLLLSVLGISVNQLFFLEGLSRSTAVNAGLVMTTIPVVTCAVAALLGHERLSSRKALGVALSTGGVAMLFLGRGAELSAATRVGDALMVLNAISYSLYLVLAKPVLRRLPHEVVLAWVFALSAVTIPWFALDVPWAPADARPVHWWALAGVLLLPTVLAYLGNIVVLSRTDASTTAAYVMLQPFLAAGLGVLVLGERLTGGVLVTAVLVIAGLRLVATGTGPRLEPAASPTAPATSSERR